MFFRNECQRFYISLKTQIMKSYLKTITTLFCFFIFQQCTFINSGVSYSGVENYFETSLYGKGHILKYAETGPWELGITFVAHKNGTIKAINIKNPELGKKRISIWDTTNRTLLATYEFNHNDDKTYLKNLISFKVDQGRTYTISMNSTQYFYHELNFRRLPISDDNITLLSTNFYQGTWQQFPDKQIDNIIHGLIDIDFQWVIN